MLISNSFHREILSLLGRMRMQFLLYNCNCSSSPEAGSWVMAGYFGQFCQSCQSAPPSPCCRQADRAEGRESCLSRRLRERKHDWLNLPQRWKNILSTTAQRKRMKKTRQISSYLTSTWTVGSSRWVPGKELISGIDQKFIIMKTWSSYHFLFLRFPKMYKM